MIHTVPDFKLSQQEMNDLTFLMTKVGFSCSKHLANIKPDSFVFEIKDEDEFEDNVGNRLFQCLVSTLFAFFVSSFDTVKENEERDNEESITIKFTPNMKYTLPSVVCAILFPQTILYASCISCVWYLW